MDFLVLQNIFLLTICSLETELSGETDMTRGNLSHDGWSSRYWPFAAVSRS